MDTLQARIDRDIFDKLPDSEAVAVRIYTNTDGEQWSEVFAAGTKVDMEDLANAPGLIILPVGLESITTDVVMVSELLMPEEIA